MTSDPYHKPNFGHTGQPLGEMDYTGYYGQQPYQFMNGLPPTPSQSNTMTSDDFLNESSPQQNNYDFRSFDAYNDFNTSGVLQPPTPPSQPRIKSATGSHHGIDGNAIGLDSNGHNGVLTGAEMQAQRHDSNSGNEEDEENMTPAQTRRKAQNRAAQRAFRERKEKHVKELEAQVAALRASTSNISTENERLRLSLQKVSTENEILKATSAHPSRQIASPSNSHSSIPDITGPMHFSPKDFYTEVLEGHGEQHLQIPSHRVINGEGGTKLLGAGATWEFILGSAEFKQGRVDVGRVSEELRGRAKCDGQGPVFEERDIRRAIEISAASGSDELI